MKNESIFPLERNNYFFGKLMTEREYDTEQAYFNNKRRLLNVSLMSQGVVCGLTVTKADGATIVVESGLAIDGQGRELAVPQLIVMLLSELDGFADDRGHMAHVYLCVEYAEMQVEPMRAMSGGTGGLQFGRVQETVRLFLRYGEPEEFEIERQNIETCRTENLEDKFERCSRMLLYLARIHLIRWEEAYEIDRIEQVPFGQYASVLALPDKPVPDGPEEMKGGEQTAPIHSYITPPQIISYGTAKVKIPAGSKQGSVYYSEDIPHSLGLVPAAITLGLSSNGSTVFGDSSIFNEDSGFEYAARVNNRDGTFIIGVRVKAKVPAQALNFAWLAAADPVRVGVDAVQTARITLSPAAARVRPLESLRITAELHGISDGEIVWSVREPDGGGITRSGMYIAPADPGVYTVIARCGGVSGTAIIVVQ